jgi:hypothetical protein
MTTKPRLIGILHLPILYKDLNAPTPITRYRHTHDTASLLIDLKFSSFLFRERKEPLHFSFPRRKQ